MRKNKRNDIITMTVSGIAGGLVGFFGASYLFEKGIGGIDWVYIFIAGFIGFYVQLALHEVGHMLGGFYSGYKFVSFRLFGFILYKKQRKIHIGRYVVPGTGGQCLMAPPHMKEGKIPYIAYNLGGIIMNIAIVELATILFAFGEWGLFGNALLVSLACFGLLFVLTNGIPMCINGITNDGYNATHLGKDTETLRAFWTLLKVNEMHTGGMRLKDMPEEWFGKASEDSPRNAMIATIEYLRCARMVDNKEFDKANLEIGEISKNDIGMTGIQSTLLYMEQIFCEILGERRECILKKMEEKEFCTFVKTMSKIPSVVRVKYAYELFIKNNMQEAEKWETRFEKITRNYPYQGEIECERELMECCKEYTK